MIPTNGNDAAFHSRIADEKQSQRSARKDLGLHARYKRLFAVLGVNGRSLHIPAKTEIQSKARMYFEIVLHEQSAKPGVVVGVFGRVLVHGDWKAEQKVPKSVALVGFRSRLGAR